MVVSAILTTALAPITGALFGASYGTAIRIGYEIIFPALFGKVKPNPDAQDVIKSLHTMFQATGGASALEFGIDQGIEMAKKKTESPTIQHLINTDLGITEEQLARRHSTGNQDSIAENQRIQKLLEQYEEGFDFNKLEAKVDFLIKNFTRAQIRKWKIEIDEGRSTHPEYNQIVINAAWAKLNQADKDKAALPPVPPKDIVTTPGAVEQLTWQQFVASNLTRLQLISIVNKYEQLIKQGQLNYNKAANTNPPSTNRVLAIIKHQYEILIEARKHHQAALSWVLKNNKSTP